MAESLNDDPVYVAVSKDVREGRLTLSWALRHLRVKKLYLFHVHQQIPMNPTSSGLEQSEIDAIQELELSSSIDSLDKYRDIFQKEGVNENDVDISCIPANDVGEGIVELIYEKNIKKLVMGAASDSNYSEGMVDITSRKAKYVSCHAPQCCKIWLVCNGKLIQTRDGPFLSSLHDHSTLIPYEEAGKAEHIIEAYVLSSSEDHSARMFEKIYYEEQRRRLEIEELKREKKQQDKMKLEREEALSRSVGVSQVLYNEEVSRRRNAEEELSRAKAEIEEMKRVQKELEEKLYVDWPLVIDMFQKERDEAITRNEELVKRLNLEKGESSSPMQWSVSNEPPPYFICPISKAIMQNPHVAADGYTYEEEEFKTWLTHGGENSPMTNLRLVNRNLTPNLVLRSAINDWLQQNPYFFE